jgi:hypothetical protein
MDDSQFSDGQQPPRRSRARERQERRRARRQPMLEAAPTARKVRDQLAPSGGFTLPKIDARFVRPLIFLAAAAFFMGTVIIAIGMLKDNPVEVGPNAIWVGDEWTYQTHDDPAVEEFVRQLRTHQIGSVYAHVSELNLDGTWTGIPEMTNLFGEVQEEVTAFVRQFKRLYPDVQLYGTIRVRADIGPEGYRLDDPELQQNVAEFSAQIVNIMGFDGVMINADPIWNGDEHFLALLRGVRQAIGSQARLAVAVPPDWTPEDVDIPTPDIIEPGTVWDEQYKQRVALIQVNQLVVHAYNSYLTSTEDYTAWMSYQVEAYAQAIASLRSNTRVMIGVPAYENALPAHDVRVENMLSALDGIALGLQRAGEAGDIVRGLAIYAAWDIDDVEWRHFRANWINR